MNIPIVSFITRYWLLLFAVLAAGWLAVSDKLFSVIGALVYLPVLVLGAAASALLVRHLFMRQTLEKDVHSGLFASYWNALTPFQRVTLNLATMGILFLGACIIAAGLSH